MARRDVRQIGELKQVVLIGGEIGFVQTGRRPRRKRQRIDIEVRTFDM